MFKYKLIRFLSACVILGFAVAQAQAAPQSEAEFQELMPLS